MQVYNFQTKEDQRKINNPETSQREKKYLTYRGAKIKITLNCSETMQASQEWSEIFKVLREKKLTNLEFCTPGNYPTKVKEKQRCSYINRN